MAGQYPGRAYRGTARPRPHPRHPPGFPGRLPSSRRPLPAYRPTRIPPIKSVGAFPIQAAKYLRLLRLLKGFGVLGIGLEVADQYGLVPWFHPPFNYNLVQCGGGFYSKNSSGSVRNCGAAFAIGSMVAQVWGVSASIDTYGPPLTFPFGNPSLAKAGRYLRIVASQPYSPLHYLPWSQPFPDYFPQLDPQAVPIKQPALNPHPVPWIAIPWRTNPRHNPAYSPHVSTRGYTSPDYRPDTGVIPWGSPVVNVNSPRVPPKPPRPPRDRKVMMQGALLAAWRYTNRAVNALTEPADFVEAIWKALPIQFQTRHAGRATTPFEMLQDLLNHWGQVSPTQAILNLIKEFGGDLAFGGLSSALKRTYADNPYFQRPIGWQTGLVF